MPIDFLRYEVRGPGGATVGIACGDAGAVVVRTWEALPEGAALTMRPVGLERFRELVGMHPAGYRNGPAAPDKQVV